MNQVPISIVGATGRLGRALVTRLLARGVPVKALTRCRERAVALLPPAVEILEGDIRDAASVRRLCEGAGSVVGASHGLLGKGPSGPEQVDGRGNRLLVDAARAAGSSHFVFVSAAGVGPTHPIDFFRIKHASEEYLRASGVPFTIIRPTAFMEFWAELIGQGIETSDVATIFGAGRNPVNFVSVRDAAAVIDTVLAAGPAGRTIVVPGPENLTLLQVAALYDEVRGLPSRRKHVPRAMLRILSVAARPFHPGFARQAGLGFLLDTVDQTSDAAPLLRDFPGLRLTPLRTVISESKKPVATGHAG